MSYTNLKQQGFTLLEMMIAFTLLSLLFLALFSSFNSMSRAWEASERRLLLSSDQRLVSEFIRSQLSQAMMLRMSNERGVTFSFEGEANAIRYAAPLQPLKTQGGVYLIELRVRSADKQAVLEMRYAPYRPQLSWQEALAEAEPVLVYDQLRSVAFEYYGAEHPLDEPRWESEWLERRNYPTLVKVALVGKEGQIWPAIWVDLPQVEGLMRR